MKKLLLVGIFVPIIVNCHSQFLLEEDFNFTGNVSGTNDWIHQSGTSNFIQTTTPSLTFTNYVGSGRGNAVYVSGVAGEDAYKKFEVRTKLYYSFMINVVQPNTSQKTGFVTFFGKEQSQGVNGTLNGNYFGRVVIKTLGDGTWQIGISNYGITNTTNPTSYSTSAFNNNQVYAVIVSLDITNNYKVSVWVKSDKFPMTENDAGTPDAIFWGAPNSNALPKDVDALGLRQDASSPTIIMDGLRIFDEWSAKVLPLKLLSFTAQSLSTSQFIELKWVTTSTENIKNFEVEKSLNGTEFTTIATINAINSKSEISYDYNDCCKGYTLQCYRLKINEYDRKYYYSSTISVAAQTQSQIKIGNLGSKKIKVFHPDYTMIKNIRVLDFNGMEKARFQIFKNEKEVLLDLSRLSAGNYILQMELPNTTISQKFILE